MKTNKVLSAYELGRAAGKKWRENLLPKEKRMPNMKTRKRIKIDGKRRTVTFMSSDLQHTRKECKHNVTHSYPVTVRIVCDCGKELSKP